MILRNIKSIWSVKSLMMMAAAIGAATVATPNAAQAGELYGSWTYTIDSFQDGTDYTQVGSESPFEFYGMAYREVGDEIQFVINSNLSENGEWDRYAKDKNIGYGELFLNFADTDSFENGEGQDGMYAIRFANNDLGDQDFGLYNNVTSQSRTHLNTGYSSQDSHTARVGRLGGEASFGDHESDTDYFDTTKAAATHMASGDYVGAVTGLDDFGDLDFGNFGATGNHTFGFSVDKSKLQVGNFVAHLFAECGNDGVVIDGELVGNVESAAVPESSPLAGLAVVSMAGGALALRKRKQAKLEV